MVNLPNIHQCHHCLRMGQHLVAVVPVPASAVVADLHILENAEAVAVIVVVVVEAAY